jgi:gamma-glutamylaminecyclotransferase
MKIFVYGTLKKGFNNNYLLKDAKFVEESSFCGKMYYYGSFPYVNLNETGEVKGEIYEINDKILGKLDILEGYPGFYNRTKVNGCYIYHIDKIGQKPINSGIWE